MTVYGNAKNYENRGNKATISIDFRKKMPIGYWTVETREVDLGTMTANGSKDFSLSSTKKITNFLGFGTARVSSVTWSSAN